VVEPHDEYDLLTAALMGAAIGAGLTLLFRRGPRGRPVVPILRAAGTGAKLAGRAGLRGAAWAGDRGARGARWAADRGAELWDRVPVDEMQEQVQDYLESAREAISDAVSEELRDLRKAIRRQRKRLGV